jgi:hypothetical protein
MHDSFIVGRAESLAIRRTAAVIRPQCFTLDFIAASVRELFPQPSDATYVTPSERGSCGFAEKHPINFWRASKCLVRRDAPAA